MIAIGLEPVAVSILLINLAAVPEPRNLTAPAIAGSGEIGTLLTATTGLWTGVEDAGFTWAWQRNRSDIPGEAGRGPVIAPHMVLAEEDRAVLRIRVTGANRRGAVTAESPGRVASWPAPLSAPGSSRLTFHAGESSVAASVRPGFSGDSLSFRLAPGSAALPGGLALSAGGVISGLPGQAVITRTVTIEARNSGGAATRDWLIAVVGPEVVADYIAGRYLRDTTSVTGFSGLHAFSRAGTATFTAASGTISLAAPDSPRFDHDGDGRPLGLLIEDPAANLFLHSSDFTQAGVIRTGVSVTPDAATAPDGTRTADRLTAGGANAVFGRSIAARAGTAVSFSIWLRSVAGTVTVPLRLRCAGVSVGVQQVSATVGWRRFGVSGTVPSGQVSVDCLIGGNNGFANGETLLAWGAQVTLDGLMSSHVPSGATPGQRGADSIALTGLPGELYDMSVVLDDLSTLLRPAEPVSGPWWPVLPRRRVRRIQGFRTRHRPLLRETGGWLLHENGTVLTEETRD